MKVEEFNNIIYDLDAETGIVTVTINRPEIKNALAITVLLELYWAVDAIENDADVKAMILTGGKPPNMEASDEEAFSSGGYFNLADLEALDEKTKSDIDLTDIAQKRLCLKMWQLDKPIIAAINGLAIGGGFTIPLACADLIYISEHAWVKLPFINLGLIPELASSYLLPRLVGFQRAKEIIYFGEKLPAGKLYDMGLVNQVLPHDELLPYVRERVRKLIPPQGAAFSVSLCKEVIHKPLIEAVTKALDSENDALLRAFGSIDFMEALNARIEKRDPVFKGS